MRAVGQYAGAQRTLEGGLCVLVEIEESRDALEQLNSLEGKKVVLELKQYRKQRSKNANDFFWSLCDKLAAAMGTTQMEVHDLMLYRYGPRGDLIFQKNMLDAAKETFDIIQPLEETETQIKARCWPGSRFCDTAEMGRLLQGTIDEARAQKIDIYTQEETDALIKAWEDDRKKWQSINRRK